MSIIAKITDKQSHSGREIELSTDAARVPNLSRRRAFLQILAVFIDLELLRFYISLLMINLLIGDIFSR